MTDIGPVSPVTGIDYDQVLTYTRNPVLRAGQFFGLLGATSRPAGTLTSDPNSNAVATMAGAFGVGEELVTIAAAASSTSASATLLPANSLILAVLARVVVAIPTAVTFTIGDATTAARFATGVAVAINTTAVGITQWSGASTTLANGPSQVAAAGVKITPSATPGTAVGRVRIQVVYIQFTAPPA